MKPKPLTTHTDLYRRGCDTLLASWTEYARGATDAALRHLPGVAVAIFPQARGCRTASLQATPMAERLYARLGFRDLGRILEYIPPV